MAQLDLCAFIGRVKRTVLKSFRRSIRASNRRRKMNKFLAFSLLFPLLCVFIAHLFPDTARQGRVMFVDLQKQLISSIEFTSKLFGFEENIDAHFQQKDDLLKERHLKLKGNEKCMPKNEALFTRNELIHYDGSEGSPGLYLAYLGVVYDVSKGAKHYGPGGGYAFFSGKDASRAFITGEFNEKGLVDDVHDLSVDSFGSVREWAEFYDKDYKRIGRLVGTYYNEEGCPTERIDYLDKMYRLYDKQRESEADETRQYPPCNSEWNGQTKITRVWCSKMSGGIERDWEGVPRKYFSPLGNGHRCACIRNDGLPQTPSIQYADDDENDASMNLKDPRIQEYSDCDSNSYECILKD